MQATSSWRSHKTFFPFLSLLYFTCMQALAVTDLPPALANMECNVTSHVKITHLFYQRMVEKKLKVIRRRRRTPMNDVILTCFFGIRVASHILHLRQRSSRPLAALSTLQARHSSPPLPPLSQSKQDVSSNFICLFCFPFLHRDTFYVSPIWLSCSAYGIDVCCLMSGPVKSNFYKDTPKLSVLNFFRASPLWFFPVDDSANSLQTWSPAHQSRLQRFSFDQLDGEIFIFFLFSFYFLALISSLISPLQHCVAWCKSLHLCYPSRDSRYWS